jgi:hypothetical protein
MRTHVVRQFRRRTTTTAVPGAYGRGVTAGRGGVWAWVVIPGAATDAMDTDSQIAETVAGDAALRALIPPGGQYHIKVQWTEHTGDLYRARESRPRMADGQATYIELGARRIDDSAYPHRRVLLGVRVDSAAPGQGALDRAHHAVGMDDPQQAAAHHAAAAMGRVVAWQARMAASPFQARPAEAAELAWSVRRDVRRTVSDLTLPGDLISDGAALYIRAGRVTRGYTHTTVETDDGDRYVRVLTPATTGLPADSFRLPGREWLRDLMLPSVAQGEDGQDGPPEPFEVSVRGVNLTPQQATKRLRDVVALSKEQQRQAAAGLAGHADENMVDAGDRMARRISEVEAGIVGMTSFTVTWTVDADTLVELDAKTAALIDQYGKRGITIWAPPGIQDLLWQERVLGDGQRVGEFAQLAPWGTVVGSWFHGGSTVGAEQGYFLGENVGSTPGPYFNRLSDAQRAGEPITTVFVGRPGVGKSTGVELSMLGEVVMGGWGLLVDLKGDLHGICDVARMLGVPVTEVSTDALAAGTLDPFRYVPDPAEAASRAIDIMQMALHVSASTAAVEGHLRRAANRVVDYPPDRVRSANAVIQELLADPNPDAQEVGDLLLNLIPDPLARPMLAAPDLSAPQLSTDPAFVYMLYDNVRWPERSGTRDGWTPGQRLSMALVQAGFAYAMYMAGRVKGIPKVVALTELHHVTGYDFGRQFIEVLAAVGRALDVNLLLDTQAAATLAQIHSLIAQISGVHAFGAGSPEEAVAQAALAGVPADAAFVEQQLRLGKGGPAAKGVCFTRDRLGRVGYIRFDYLCAEFKAALNTTPVRDTDRDLVGADA